MSYTVPYSFVPGTKARAQEVNANFAAINDSLDNIDANKVDLDFSNITSDAINVIKNNSSIRNIGELIFSPIPLTDGNLHLLDGSLIDGNGIYRDFVNYMRNKYNTNSLYNPNIFNVTGSVNVTTNGIASNFSTNGYVSINETLTLGDDFELYLPFTCNQNSTSAQIYRGQNNSSFVFLLNQTSNGSVQFNMTDGTNSLGSPIVITYGDLIVNDNYIVVIKQKNQTCTYGYIHNGTYTQTGQKTNYPLSIPSINMIRIGRGTDTCYGGSIDLKSFTINVNGSEILSGKNNCNYFTDEGTWQDTVDTYGECGKFVYDTSANTVRLPKIKGLIEYTTTSSESGNLTEAGLPNIRGFIDELCTYSSSEPTGAFSQSRSAVWKKSGVDQTLYQKDVHFDASRSSDIYGKSSTVQPQTIKYLVYIVIASTPKTNLQIDIDNIATDLNGKLDADLTNLSDTNIKNFDGQWVYKHSAINNNATLNTGKYDVDLSSYLPSGQNKYEVLVNISASQSSSNTVSYLILSSSIIPEAGTTVSFANLGANANSRIHDLVTTFPVGANKILSYRIGGQSFDTLYIRLCGYRRIGTNG